jgi:hypothetical protein
VLTLKDAAVQGGYLVEAFELLTQTRYQILSFDNHEAMKTANEMVKRFPFANIFINGHRFAGHSKARYEDPYHPLAGVQTQTEVEKEAEERRRT